MNMKNNIALNIALGSTITGSVLAVVGYFSTISSSDSSILGAESDWWLLAVGVGSIVGIVIGGISPIAIVGFRMNYFKVILFGGILNLLIVLGFHIFSDGQMSQAIRYPLYSLVPIGMLNGAVVSILSAFYSPR